MKKNEIHFDLEDLIGSVEAVAEHVSGRKKQNLRITTVSVPKPAPALSPAQVRSIRNRLKMSQSGFAALLNVPLVTAVSWEKGRRSPSGAALRLQEVARKHPDLLAKATA